MASAPGSTDRPAAARKKRRRVLVVDDIAENRAFLRDLCHGWGLEVLEAADGAEALAVCRAAEPPPAAAIVDQLMPVLDGWGFLRGVRAEPALAALPVFLVSAAPGKPPEGFPAEVAFDHLLMKPIDQAALAEALRRHLGLEWVRAERTDQAAPGSEQCRTLAPQQFGEFEEMVTLRRVIALQRRADTLGAEEPGCAAFAAQVKGLCRAVDLAGLRRLLEEQRGGAGEHPS